MARIIKPITDRLWRVRLDTSREIEKAQVLIEKKEICPINRQVAELLSLSNNILLFTTEDEAKNAKRLLRE